ncbi:MAG TPA: pilin [Candidatus Saccharimonadales bacterium]|nr:pilin [Candidatus Saccharimonadales bacterium]
MIKKLRNILVIAVGLTVIAVPALVHAQSLGSGQIDISGSICAGTQAQTLPTTTNCDDATSGTAFTNIVTTIINIFSLVVGAVSVIMIIVGGFRYITSGGNDTGIAGAKNTIIYALIGLVIVALAQLIVHFVLAKAIEAGGTSTSTSSLFLP